MAGSEAAGLRLPTEVIAPMRQKPSVPAPTEESGDE